LGIIVHALGIFVLWKSKKQTIVVQSIMQAEMIATAYRKVQLDRLRCLISELGSSKSITRKILNDGLNDVRTLNSGNFQSDSRHLRLQYHSIHEAIATSQIEVLHIPGVEMLEDALTEALWGVNLREFVQEVGLH
jgi:hypothetical protein